MCPGGEGGGLFALLCAREGRGSHKNLISCFSCLWNTQTVPSVCRYGYLQSTDNLNIVSLASSFIEVEAMPVKTNHRLKTQLVEG